MRQVNIIRGLMLIMLFFFVVGCGEEYYSTPEKTLARYVDARKMSKREEYESCLNSFRKQDREWWDANWLKVCRASLGQDCPGEGIAGESAVWELLFEGKGPNTTTVESSSITGEEATLIVNGKTIPFIKERGNWKIKGFFGVPEELKAKYPDLQYAKME